MSDICENVDTNKRFKTFEEAHNFFYGKKNHFWDLGLENIRAFLSILGSPQEKMMIIQIAGTNGKGSVSAFLSSILYSSGYKVGRYNSPAVFHEGENIVVNNVSMSKNEFVYMVNYMYEAIDMSEKNRKLPTIFELETAMAICYFYLKKCDVIILEAGLGGKTDATNVSADNIMAVFSSISLDHMNFLGNTVEEIARVKAGIIKDHSLVVMGVNDDKVKQIIKEEAESKDDVFEYVNKDNIHISKTSLYEQLFTYDIVKGEEKAYKIKLSGINQTENAALSIHAASLLKEKYPIKFGKITDETIKAGLDKTAWEGRFEVISHSPLVIIDGAHNPDAAKRLKENIVTYLKDYNIVSIMGVFKDKDYESIINIMEPYLKNVIVIKAAGERGLEPALLRQEILCKIDNANVLPETDYKKAYDMATKLAEKMTKENGKNTAIIVFGSLSYLKYIKSLMGEKKDENWK